MEIDVTRTPEEIHEDYDNSCGRATIQQGRGEIRRKGQKKSVAE